MRRSMSSLWWRDSNQTASGKPGAVQFGGRYVRVRGYDKVFTHLMFGMTALAASQLMRLMVPPI